MKKLRVLQLGPYPPPRGGVQTNVLAIQDEIWKRGHHSEIVAITRSARIGNETNVHHPNHAFDLVNLLRRIPHDVVHLHIGGNLRFRVKLLMIAASIFSRGRTVLTFHSGGFVKSAAGKNPLFWSLAGFAFRRFERVIGVNSQMIDMFKAFGVRAERIRLIHAYHFSKPDPGVSIPKNIEAFFRDHDKVLVTVGLLEDEYDIPFQINALGDILVDYPGTGLLVVGSGSLEPEIRNLAASKPYRDHILFAGDTDRAVVLKLLDAADVLLRTTRFDGDSISVRDGLYLETPVIATDTGLRPEGVLLIDAGDVGGLVEKIKVVFDGEFSPPKSKDETRNIGEVVDLYERLTGAAEPG